MTQPKLTEAQKAKCIEAFEHGAERKALAQRFDASTTTIGKVLIEAGYTRKHP